MARKARRELIAEDQVGIYHIYSRTVRRSFLFGEDYVTGRSYDHRLELLSTLVRTLARVFAIDVLGYGFMQNHFHEILRNRPDIAARLSGIQVATRIILLEELGLKVTLEPQERSARKLKRLRQRIANLLDDKERLQRARQTLSSISRYEQRLKQTISRIANLEDGVTGHFWEGRFESIRIEDLEQLLTTMVYVDLNAVRAGITQTPETSRYTSVYDRIQGLQSRLAFAEQEEFEHVFTPEQHAAIQSLAHEHEVRRLLDNWLSPIDERREGIPPERLDVTETVISEDFAPWEAMQLILQGSDCASREGEGVELPSGDSVVAVQEANSSAAAQSNLDELLSDLPQIKDLPPRASNKGCFSMRLQDYLQLVDWTGRQVRADKRGSIPKELSPILSRLGIDGAAHWLKNLNECGARLKKAFSAPVNQLLEATRCVIRTAEGPQAFPEAML